MTLRLLPGRSPKDAFAEVERQEMALGNVRTGNNTNQDLLREYLTWAIEAERMLRSHFTGDSVSSHIFTRRYWAPQSSGPSNLELVRPLVDVEITEQSEWMVRAKELLNEGLHR
ncbi:MAG: hypothetical protein ABIQ53_16505 [Terracoccus sp.]